MKSLGTHDRKSIRLKKYDYSSPGEYFITICTHNRECILGEIVGDKMQLSLIGKVVQECWEKIPRHFSNVETDAFIIMPNHVHGIIIINDYGRDVLL
jgi:REP element-mobilizing transposase RayT